MKKEKPRSPVSHSKRLVSDPEIMGFYDWLKQHFSFLPSASLNQLFQRYPPSSFSRFPELHYPVQLSDPDDWAHMVRVWGFLGAARPTGRILDIGSGDGWPGIPISIRGRTVVGLDAASRRVAAAASLAESLEAKNSQFLEMNAERLEFHDQTFDSVIFSRSLEYCRDPESVLAEAWRVLTPGGRIIVFADSMRAQESAGRMFESFHHPLDAERWQFNFRFRFFDSDIEETLSLVFPRLQKILFENRQPLLKDVIFQNRHSVPLVQKFFSSALHQELECLSSHVTLYSSKSLVTRLKKVGFQNVHGVQDPGKIAKQFLAGQNLADANHPFLNLPTFESICSGLGAVAVKNTIDTALEDGFVIAEKPFS